jgi:ribosomal protein L15
VWGEDEIDWVRVGRRVGVGGRGGRGVQGEVEWAVEWKNTWQLKFWTEPLQLGVRLQ